MKFYKVANAALYVNLAWYVILFVLFSAAGNLGKALYFLGATILTVGVIIL